MKSLRTTAIRSDPASELCERFLTKVAPSRDGNRYHHPVITSRRQGDDTADAVSGIDARPPMTRGNAAAFKLRGDTKRGKHRLGKSDVTTGNKRGCLIGPGAWSQSL